MFRIFNLDYFYLNLKKFYNKNDIVTIKTKIIYREIYTFYYRVDNYITIIKEKKFKN
jgi:hypothetical protein